MDTLYSIHMSATMVGGGGEDRNDRLTQRPILQCLVIVLLLGTMSR